MSRVDRGLSTLILALSPLPLPALGQADGEARPPAPAVAAPALFSRVSVPTDGRGGHLYVLSTIYDRVTGRTRITVVPIQPGHAPVDRPTMSLAATIEIPGREQVGSPDWVELEFTAFSPARSGWALAHARPLEITIEDSIRSAYEAQAYERLSVGFHDPGRRETVRYRIPTPDFLRLAAASRVKLKIGRVTTRLDERRDSGLQALAGRIVRGS